MSFLGWSRLVCPRSPPRRVGQAIRDAREVGRSTPENPADRSRSGVGADALMRSIRLLPRVIDGKALVRPWVAEAPSVGRRQPRGKARRVCDDPVCGSEHPPGGDQDLQRRVARLRLENEPPLQPRARLAEQPAQRRRVRPGVRGSGAATGARRPGRKGVRRAPTSGFAVPATGVRIGRWRRAVRRRQASPAPPPCRAFPASGGRPPVLFGPVERGRSNV